MKRRLWTSIFANTAGPRLRCFLSTAIRPILGLALMIAAPAWAQVVCVATPEECVEAQKQLCKNEPAPANLFVAHSVRLSGAFLDSTGARLDFDSIKPGYQTIIQIKNAESGEIIFAVPLRKNGEFEFESVPAGSYRLIAVWMHNGKFQRLPLANQPSRMECKDETECRVIAAISFHGTDNMIDSCPPK